MTEFITALVAVFLTGTVTAGWALITDEDYQNLSDLVGTSVVAGFVFTAAASLVWLLIFLAVSALT